jgi:hypothetical protein
MDVQDDLEGAWTASIPAPPNSNALEWHCQNNVKLRVRPHGMRSASPPACG